MTYTLGADALTIRRPYTTNRRLNVTRTSTTQIDTTGLMSRTELPTNPVGGIEEIVQPRRTLPETTPFATPREAWLYARRVADNILSEGRNQYTLPKY